MRKKKICILKTTPLPWLLMQWLLVNQAPPEIERREVLLSISSESTHLTRSPTVHWPTEVQKTIFPVGGKEVFV